MSKTPILRKLYFINWLTCEFWTRTGWWELITPMALAHPLHPINNRSWKKRRDPWFGRCVSFWRPLFPSRNSVLIYIYIYVCLLYGSFVIERIYTYTRSVIQYWWNCPIIGLFFGNARFLCWMPLFVFFGLPIVSCSMINSLIRGCLWPLVFVSNNILTLGIWRSAVSHLPGCFCPWAFFQYIGFNMVPSDPFMSHLDIYFTWIFCRGVSGFATHCPCGVWINHLPPVCWPTFWKSTFKQQLGCRFDILDYTSSSFCILTYAIVYVFIHHMLFRFYLYFLNCVLFYQVLLY